MLQNKTDGQSAVNTETMPTEQANVQLPSAEGEVDQQAKAQQSQNGVVANLPFQMIEEKVILGKTNDAIKFIQDLGNTNAKMEIAVSILRNGNDDKDAEMAFEMFHDIAMTGNAEAAMVLACFYIKGYGCEKNKTLADLWHLKARVDDLDENMVFDILGMNDKDNDYE